ncbi:MAG: lysophospholipid acyltransferase family protein, partial [Bradyrhizobium sp.]
MVGASAAQYLRLVWRTTRFIIEPADWFERIPNHTPVIVTMWHGQHFLIPFMRPRHLRAFVLISRHRDGEINAITAERLGIETIRGSGTHGTDIYRKGGVYGFREMVATLKQGHSVALTADVPKVSRVAGLGVVKVAQISGRPI